MEVFFLALFIFLNVYFLPSYIGFRRKKKNGCAILALNFLAGWTFVGWVIAFVWALTNS